MYTQKQKALFRGLCYAVIAWLCVGMVASVAINVYIYYSDSDIIPREFGKSISTYVFAFAGAPAFIIGYSRQMNK